MLTNWDSIQQVNPNEPAQIGRSWAAVWAKVITSWVAIVMYIWTLIAPMVLPDREWG